MADNKKYYYLKLVDNFFERDEVIFLENQSEGDMYVNILLKLYLRSLKNEGKLMFREKIPYSPEMLAQICRKPVAVIEKAIFLFEELGLLERVDTGAMFMSDIQEFIGRSSTEADRKRKYRKSIEGEKVENGTFVPKLSGQISTRDRDRDIIRDRDRDIIRDRDRDIIRDRDRDIIRDINIDTNNIENNFVYPSIYKYIDLDKEINENFIFIDKSLISWIRATREKTQNELNRGFNSDDNVYLITTLLQDLYIRFTGKTVGMKTDKEIFDFVTTNINKFNPDTVGDILSNIKELFNKAERQGKKISSFNYIVKCLNF